MQRLAKRESLLPGRFGLHDDRLQEDKRPLVGGRTRAFTSSPQAATAAKPGSLGNWRRTNLGLIMAGEDTRLGPAGDRSRHRSDEGSRLVAFPVPRVASSEFVHFKGLSVPDPPRGISPFLASGIPASHSRDERFDRYGHARP